MAIVAAMAGCSAAGASALASLASPAATGAPAASPASPAASSTAPPAAHVPFATTLSALRVAADALGPALNELGMVRCQDFQKNVSPLIVNLRPALEVATAERSSLSPGVLAGWQKVHERELTALVESLAAPLRRVVCAANESDQSSWLIVKPAMIALAQPPSAPPFVTERLAVFRWLASNKLRQDCPQLKQELTERLKAVKASHEPLSPLLLFVDDVVWEEELKRDDAMAQIEKIPCSKGVF